jgi:GxxExxY protein
VYYEGQWVGTRRLDLLVNDVVIVELKAVSEIEGRHINQLLNYMNAFNIEVGLLINFGSNKLEFKRYYNSKFDEGPR